MIKLKQYGVSTEGLSNTIYTVEFLAKLVHEAIRHYNTLIGDTTLVAWDETDESTKESTRKGVLFVIQNPETTPSETHAKWVEDRTCEGWSFGDVKNPDTKEHPCLVAYDELPVEHRMKDHLFNGVVLAVWNTLTEDQRLTVSTECDCESASGMWR